MKTVKVEGCKVEGCTKAASYKGFCNSHYIKNQRYGDPLGGPQRFCRFTQKCAHPGCDRVNERGAYCTKHAQRVAKYGTSEPSKLAKSNQLSYKDRLLSRMKVNEETGCWEWTARCEKKFGYGVFWYKDKLRQAHRVSYIELVGPIPDGLHVLHKCDNPCCINPDHLFLGTNADNMHDRTQKNRQARGSKCGSAKLTEKDVVLIKKRFESFVADKSMSAQCNVIADEFNVSGKLIRNIYQGRAWKHVI